MQKLILQWQENNHTHHYTTSSTPNESILIGRHHDCHITLNFPTISRRHAQLFINNQAWYIRNISEVNPIHFGDQQLTKNQQAILEDGKYFRIGPVWLQVVKVEEKKEKKEEKVPELKLKCRRCKNVVDYKPEEFCPWCGMALQAGETVLI